MGKERQGKERKKKTLKLLELRVGRVSRSVVVVS